MTFNTQTSVNANRLGIDLFQPLNLGSLVTKPTAKDGTTIDHIYAIMDNKQAHVVPTYLSDHDLIRILNIQERIFEAVNA